MVEELVASAILRDVLAHDDIRAITCDDAINEVCFAQQPIVAIVFGAGQVQAVATIRREGIELCQRAIYKCMATSIDIDGVAKRIAYLRVCDLADAIVELQAVASDVMEDATIECDGWL